MVRFYADVNDDGNKVHSFVNSYTDVREAFRIETMNLMDGGTPGL